MKNCVHLGDYLTVTAPATVASGDLVQINDICGVASGDAVSGDPVVLVRCGVFTLPKVTASNIWAVGAKLYATNAGTLSASPSGNKLIGVATLATANGDTTAQVLLDGAIR